MTSDMLAVEASGVSKSFQIGYLWRRRALPVLRHVNLRLGQGECLIVEGENGSGKSTLLRILASLVLADTGSVRIFGRSPAAPEARAQMGYATGDERSLLLRLTVSQNLSFFGSLQPGTTPKWRAHVVEQLGLTESLDRAAGECSTGVRLRTSLARSVLNSPKLLLLDEVTRGLDESATRAVLNLLKELLGSGSSIVTATHSSVFAEHLPARRVRLTEGALSDPTGPS